MHLRRKSQLLRPPGQAGATLVEVLVASLFVGGMVVGALQVFTDVNRVFQQARITNDWMNIRESIAADINCIETFANAGIDPSVKGTPSCPSTSKSGKQAEPYFGIYLGQSSPQLLGNYNAATKSWAVGGWSLRASCSTAEGTIVVRAARIDAAGGFLKSPVSGETYNWDSPKTGLLFGDYDSNGVALCAKFFNPIKVATCPTNHVFVGYDPSTNKPICINAVSPAWKKPSGCPAGQGMTDYSPGSGGSSCATFASAKDFCDTISGVWASGQCNVTGADWFGGAFQRGDKGGGCETANPKTGSCSCPAGHTELSLGHINEVEAKPKGQWDENFLCVKY
jgi:hypothetical protein